MQVAKIFQGEDNDNEGLVRPWDQADSEGWLDVLNWKLGLIPRTTHAFIQSNQHCDFLNFWNFLFIVILV